MFYLICFFKILKICFRDKIRNNGVLKYADATLLSDTVANKLIERRPAKVAMTWISHRRKIQRYTNEGFTSNSKKICERRDQFGTRYLKLFKID